MTMNRMICLNPIDSPELAQLRRKELQLPRSEAAELGRSAVRACEQGFFLSAEGRRISLAAALEQAMDARRSIPPEAELPQAPGDDVAATRVQVANETTLGAAWRLTCQGHRPLALNFANGVNPGGGFLSGALAQEEVLCRSSALYLTLAGDAMYAAHRRRPRPDSTDWAILSPEVPVFRRDDGTSLEQPWRLGFLTCAAPYAPRVGQPESGDLLAQRMRRVLAIAVAYGYRSLVLGAWGCGAFYNDPERAARDFRAALEEEYAGRFAEVVFAIADWSEERRFLGPFAKVFAPDG